MVLTKMREDNRVRARKRVDREKDVLRQRIRKLLMRITLEVEVQNDSEICSLIYNGGELKRHGRAKRDSREKKTRTLTSANQMKAY